MDITKMDKAREKVGGLFKLTTLVQKRIREVIKSGLLKEKDSTIVDKLMDKILDEIITDQIYFADEGEPRQGREEPDKAKK